MIRTGRKFAAMGVLARGLAGASLVAVGIGGLAAPAFAQTAAADDDGLAEIIVTGSTKRQENTMDVPISVTAFSGEALEAKNAVQLSDVAAYTPGFSVLPHPGNATALLLTLRGQVQGDILATLEPSVGTYVDDLYWARAYGLNAGLLDVSSVQVLKGPQGTLFGRNTTGGALVLTSADPDTKEFSGKGAITYGRFNEISGEVAVNVPVSSRIAVRGAFRLRGRDGWAFGTRLVDAAGVINNSGAATNVVVPDGRKFNDRQEVQGRAKALFEFSDSTNLIVSGEWYDFKSDGPGRQLLYKVSDAVSTNTGVFKYINYYQANPSAVGADAFDCSYSNLPTSNCSDSLTQGRRPYTDAKTSTYSARFSSDLGFGTFKLIGGYRKIFTDNFIDLDGSGSLLHATSLTQDLSQKSVEAQLAGATAGDRIKYVVGATYFTEEGMDRSFSMSGTGNNLGNAPATATRNLAFIDNKSIGVYGQASWSITDAITLTGGLRYSDDKKGIDIRSANINLFGQLTSLAGAVFPTGFVAGGQLTDPCNASALTGGLGLNTITGATPTNDCSATKSAKFNELSYTAGIDIKPTDDLLLYAKISKGYRSGGHNLRAFNDLQFTPFLPETVVEEEVGLKAELMDRRVRITLAGYHNKISNAQRSTIITTGAVSNTLVGNAATVRNIGFEGDLTVQPTTGLTLTASGSINKPKYLSYSDASGDRSGERFANIPREKLALGAAYTGNLSSSLTGTINVDYTWTGTQAANACTATGPSSCYAGAAGLNGDTTAQISLGEFNATRLPSIGVVNARLGLGLGGDKYRLSFWGNNITNNRRIVSALLLNAPRRNYVSGLRHEPATYGVTAAVKF
jgi:iron complex outermembrane recepter protein